MRRSSHLSDSDIVKTWRGHGENSSAAARSLGLNEWIVRGALTRESARKPRAYNRLPLAGEELYRAYLAEGGDRHSARRLAERFRAKPQSVRAALRRYLDKQEASGE